MSLCRNGSYSLIQLLNIAGLGPIFGAMQGCFMGTGRIPLDYIRYNFLPEVCMIISQVCFLNEMTETSISEACGIYLGNVMKNVMRVMQCSTSCHGWYCICSRSCRLDRHFGRNKVSPDFLQILILAFGPVCCHCFMGPFCFC